MEPIGVGILGYGRIGNEHAGWIAASGAARVAAVYDPTPARRDLARQKGHPTCDTIEQLLAAPDVQAVLVATPTSMHADHASLALQAGKHVMIEKPMALDHFHAHRVAELAKAAGRVVSVFHCRRWDIDYLTVKQAIESGRFGRVLNVESRLGQFASCVGPAAKEYRPGWRNEAAFGGGGLFDWGSHFVDQLWQLMRPARPTHVFAQLRNNVWSNDCDDFARLCIDFDNGAVGLCEINTTTARPLPRWHIDGTAGSASSPASLAFDTHQWAQLTFTDPEQRETPVAPAAPGLSEPQIWRQFGAACNGAGEPAVDVSSVLITMRLLDAARLSSREKRVVEFTA